MSNRVMHTAAALFLAAGSAVSMAGGAIGHGAGLTELRAAYPGVRMAEEGGRVTTIYGKPMTGGATPEAAAAAWIQKYGDAFGVGPLDLRLDWSCESGQGTGTVFAYVQYVGGLPVEMSAGRILVRNGEGNRVTYAAGKFSPAPQGGFAPMQWNGTQAMAVVKAMPAYGGMTEWTQAELVAYEARDEEGAKPLVRAWKFRGDGRSAIDKPMAYTFFVDAATGALVGLRDEILFEDLSGTVKGKGSPGLKPDENGNSPVDLAIPSVRVDIQGGNTAYTGNDGKYTVVNGGNQQVTVSTNLDNGKWANVNNQAGAVLSLSQSATPPGPADFMFNASPTEFNTAQVNAFIHQTLTHDYFKNRAPGFLKLDVAFPANVNIASSCNAFYNGSSTNFYRSGGGCVNTAYSTVVAHEYGHHIVNRLGLTQDAFGEGYGDTIGVLLYDTGIVGQDFFGPGGGNVRNIDAANKQYPCNGEAHDCGQVVAGVWRDTALKFKTTFGSQLGLELAQQLQVDWSLISTGPVDGGQSAGPTTAIQVFTVNDDDGDIDNGVPDYADLKYAFNKHNIVVPEIKLLAFAYPDGLPSQLMPGKQTDFRVNVSGISDQPQPGTGQLSFRLGNGNFTTVSMQVVGNNQYVATLPSVDCLQRVDYYIQAKTVGGKTAFDPAGAPGEFRKAFAFSGSEQIVSDSFESDSGWIGGAQGDTATTGKWNRMDPEQTNSYNNGNIVQSGDDHTANGTVCWVTDGFAGADFTQRDVDGGKTTLLSPMYDLSAYGDATVGFWLWYTNDEGDNPNADTFRVDVSVDGGTNWKNALTVGPSGPSTHAGWNHQEFRVSAAGTPSATTKFRFIAEDAGGGSIVEALVDDFTIDGLLCGGDACYADFNGDEALDLFDFLAYVNAFNAGEPKADCDGNGGLDFFDFLCFQNAFVAGC